MGLKIFLGCYDIASILSGLAEGFKDLGHSVTTFVFEQNKFYPDVKYDIVFQQTKKNNNKFIPRSFLPLVHLFSKWSLESELRKKSKEWIAHFDLFVFIWRPWLDEDEVFKEIKKSGKKIISIHCGSEVRHISAYKQEYQEDVKLWERLFHEEDLNEKIRKIRLHELYADVIFSVPDQSGLAIRPYNHIYLPICKIKEITFNIPARILPLVIHAPSRSGIKGTSIILEVMEKLKHEGHQFTFELIQDVSNNELIKKLESADILVDEIFLHGPGVLSAEGMLAGCAVATRTLNEYKNIFNPPVVNINPRNIYFELKQLLENFNYRIELAEKGRKFAEMHNNPKNIASAILQKLETNTFDYTPSFYMEKYLLPDNVKLTSENKATSYELAKKYYLGNQSAFERAELNALI